MKLLHIAVHHHKGWGAEHWLSRAFERQGCQVTRYDYRSRRNWFVPWAVIHAELTRINRHGDFDAVFIQRAEKMPATIPRIFECPTIFWSSEPLNRRNDVHKMLSAGKELDWVFVHTYTSLDIVKKKYPGIAHKCSVFHYAAPVEMRHETGQQRKRLAIFNRRLSQRRREWLEGMHDLVEVIQDRYGEAYFEDLQQSEIALNVHFGDASVDDFETGIFEAMSSGCAVISETVNPQVVHDMGMEGSFFEVANPAEMRAALEQLRDDPELLRHYQSAGQQALAKNQWDDRAAQILSQFRTVGASS